MKEGISIGHFKNTLIPKVVFLSPTYNMPHYEDSQFSFLSFFLTENI